MLWQAFGRWGAIGASEEAAGGVPFFVNMGAYGNASATSVTPGYPTGIAANDILILHVHLDDGLGNATISSVGTGWTLIDSETLANDSTAALYWRRATGSESGTITVTVSEDVNSGCLGARISAWRSCKTSGDPYEGASHTNQGSGLSFTGPTVTTTGPNRRVIAFNGSTQTVTSTTASDPANWAKNYEIASAAGGNQRIGCYSREALAAGVIGACTATRSSDAAFAMITFGLALIPA
jgi:hypothetical protein